MDPSTLFYLSDFYAILVDLQHMLCELLFFWGFFLGGLSLILRKKNY